MKFKYPKKENFGVYPTPIIAVNEFFGGNDNYNIFLKRDDLTGLELSGNKTRKLEYIFADAKNKNAKHVITCGGVQSNHCRTAAFLAAKQNYGCTLFLKGQTPAISTGNYLLNSILNTKIINITNEEYQTVDEKMQKYADELDDNAYVIPEGGSNEIGVWGYIECFFESLNQIKEQNLNIDTIVVATGSGGTQAGLVLGKYLAESSLNIVSVNVCDTSAFFVNKIKNICDKFSSNYNIPLNVVEKDINVVDGFVGEGYGIISKKEITLIKKFAQSEGIVIDPVYTAKALVGLSEMVKKKTLPGKNILFIHTGGIFGLFPFAEKF